MLARKNNAEESIKVLKNTGGFAKIQIQVPALLKGNCWSKANPFPKKFFEASINLILLHRSFQPIKFMTKKQKFTLEYPVRSSPGILFEFLSTASGLNEWFADKVDDNKEGIFTFSWKSSSEKAELMEKHENKMVRFHWLNTPKEEYFQFDIEKSEVTNQTILIITDFAEKKEIKDQTQLWEYQLKDLFHRIGA